MLDFRCSNTEGEGSECTMGGSMGVTADDSGTGKSEPLFGSDDMDDTLTVIAEAEVGEIEGFYVVFEGCALQTGILFLNEARDVLVTMEEIE
jgi:hypothetical protein